MYVSWSYWGSLLMFLLQIVFGQTGAPEVKAPVKHTRVRKSLHEHPTLSDQDMLGVMMKKGVPFLPDYMAINEEQAKDQFPNMLEMADTYNEEHGHGHRQLFHPNMDNLRSKAALIQHLNAYQGLMHSQEGVNVIKGQEAMRDRLHELQNATAKLFGRNLTHTSKMLQDLILSPNYLGSKFSIRHKRQINTAGAETVTEYCKPRGSLTSGNLTMRLCKTCAATTSLPADHFPRVINEVVCSDDDRSCLTVSGVAHGKCRQKVFHLNMLRRRNESSLTTMIDETFLNEWEVYTQPIRISCECEVDKRSLFARYVCGPNTEAPVCNTDWTTS